MARGETYNSFNKPGFQEWERKSTHWEQTGKKDSHNLCPKFKQPLNLEDEGKETLKGYIKSQFFTKRDIFPVILESVYFG